MNVIALIVCFGLFFLGLAAMAWAFSFVGFEGYVFFGGILCVTFSIIIPVHILPRFD